MNRGSDKSNFLFCCVYVGLTFLFAGGAHADIPLSLIRALSNQEIHREIQSPSPGGIAIDFFRPAIATEAPQLPACEAISVSASASSPAVLPGPSATPSPSISPSSVPQYEVLLITEVGNPHLGDQQELPRHAFGFRAYQSAALAQAFKATQPNTLSQVSSSSLLSWAQNASQNLNVAFDPSTDVGRSLVVEAMIQSVAQLGQKSESELSVQLAQAISELSADDEERFAYLSILSSRLYQNYNDARNPGANNASTNPLQIAIPEGDLSLSQIFQAAAQGDSLNGGVCNDIVETVAMIGENLFKDKDVLTITGGTHFGLIVSDGKQTRVLDASTQFLQKNRIELDPKLSASNVRVSKVESGQLKEIAILDSQMGQLLNSAYQSNRPLLKTGGDIHKLLSTYKKTTTKQSSSLTGGIGELNHSKVVVFVAKIEAHGDRNSRYLGAGAGLQRFEDGDKQYLAHLRAGWDHRFVFYKNPKLELKFDSGVHVDGLAAFNPAGGVQPSGGLHTKNEVALSYQKKPQSTTVRANAQLWNSLGSSSWGRTTGALSTVDAEGLWRAARGLNLHLNQFAAEAEVKVPLSKPGNGSKPTLGSLSSAQYQGSNVGQRVDFRSGILVESKDQTEIYMFVGATTSALKGFRTQHSLLTGPQGAQAGIRLKNKSGLQIEGGVSNIAPGQKPQIRSTAIVPLYKNKKPKPKNP